MQLSFYGEVCLDVMCMEAGFSQIWSLIEFLDMHLLLVCGCEASLKNEYKDGRDNVQCLIAF